jgi:hypothetical protein
MYRYDEFDHTLVSERVAQFRRQVERRLSGEINEDQFKPLRALLIVKKNEGSVNWKKGYENLKNWLK